MGFLKNVQTAESKKFAFCYKQTSPHAVLHTASGFQKQGKALLLLSLFILHYFSTTLKRLWEMHSLKKKSCSKMDLLQLLLTFYNCRLCNAVFNFDYAVGGTSVTGAGNASGIEQSDAVRFC